MKQKRAVWVFVAAVVLLPVSVYAIVHWWESAYKSLPVYGGEEHVISDFRMLNQQGKKITATDYKGKIVITDFFFTHCASICPKMTRSLKTVQQVFANDDKIVINSFSVDPQRDSVERLTFYASQFGLAGNWNLLTGDKKEIYRLARKSFEVTATDGDGGPGDFIHSDKLVLTDASGRIRGYYNGTDKVEVGQLIKDIGKLKRELN